MKAFFEGIQYLFENILFIPLNFFRRLELENWWAANIVSWIFVIIGFVATIYWIQQLKIYKDTKEEEQETSAHSFFS